MLTPARSSPRCPRTRGLYEFLHENPAIEFLPVDYVNDPRVIAEEPCFVSINATTEVDLVGQCASETINGRYWSSSGGQGDFARGAMYSPNGQAFVVLPSTAARGAVSRIRAALTPARWHHVEEHVDHIVTEYGVADLRGRSISQRAAALIAIANPSSATSSSATPRRSATSERERLRRRPGTDQLRPVVRSPAEERQMKAAVYYATGAPDVLRYEDVEEPSVRPGGVLIDVEAISIEGGDTLNRLGGAMTSTPHIVGYQCAGTIRSVGDAVNRREVGQRVVASMANVPRRGGSVPAGSTWPVPTDRSPGAACVPIAFGTADDCLFEFGRLRSGETVLVQAGAGGVGLAAIQLAKRAGATVLATASSAAKLERLQAYGLDHGINYRDTDFAEEARRLTDGRGVDLVVEAVGSTVLAASARSPTGAASRTWATPVGTPPHRRAALMAGNRRSPACSWAPRCR